MVNGKNFTSHVQFKRVALLYPGNNPCEDKRYLQIVEKMDKEGIGSLSEPEWKYYEIKDKACVEYGISLRYIEKEDERKQLEKGRGIRGLVIAVVFFGILFLVIQSTHG